MRPGRFEDRFRKFFVLFLLIAVAAVFLNMVQNFLVALFLAAMFTALIYSWQRFFTHAFGGRSRLAAVVVVLLFVLAVGIPMLAMTGMVVAEAVQISGKVMPWIKDQLQNQQLLGPLPHWLPFREELAPYRLTLIEKTGQGVAAAGKFLVGNVPDVTQETMGVLINGFVMLYAMFFFLVHGPEWLHKAKHYVPLQEEDRDLVVKRGYDVTRAALKAILIIGVLQGVLIGLAFWAAGLQGAAFWGAIVLVLAAIPGLGPALVWGPAAIWLFATGEIAWGIGMLLWGAVIVGLVDNILRPMVVGRDTRMPDLLVLVSTLGGLLMFGIAGILIGPVLAAILVMLLDIYHGAFATALPDDD